MSSKVPTSVGVFRRRSQQADAIEEMRRTAFQADVADWNTPECRQITERILQRAESMRTVDACFDVLTDDILKVDQNTARVRQLERDMAAAKARYQDGIAELNKELAEARDAHRRDVAALGQEFEEFRAKVVQLLEADSVTDAATTEFLFDDDTRLAAFREKLVEALRKV